MEDSILRCVYTLQEMAIALNLPSEKISSINYYTGKEKIDSIINSKITNKEFGRKISKKDIRANLKITNNIKNQKQFTEIKLIICEKVSSKIYYNGTVGFPIETGCFLRRRIPNDKTCAPE